MRVVWAALVLAGCWTSTQVVATTPPPPDPGPPVASSFRRPLRYRTPCEIAIDHIVEVVHDDLDKVPDLTDRMDALREAGVASCSETRWADETLQCFDEAVETSDLGRCESSLTPDQTGDVMKRMTEVMSASTGP